MAKSKSSKQEAHLRGEVAVRPLDGVRPNGWNPNKVPAHVMRSIEHGFRADGWITSNALLIWGTDETGARRDLIIDGEHKWKAARAVGLREGPMVVLDGVTEREARALTVKMNQKRGDWDEDGLGALLKSIREDDAEQALDLGIERDEIDRLIRHADVDFHPAPEGGQGRLDQLSPFKCPNCGAQVPRRAAP